MAGLEQVWIDTQDLSQNNSTTDTSTATKLKTSDKTQIIINIYKNPIILFTNSLSIYIFNKIPRFSPLLLSLFHRSDKLIDIDPAIMICIDCFHDSVDLVAVHYGVVVFCVG